MKNAFYELDELKAFLAKKGSFRWGLVYCGNHSVIEQIQNICFETLKAISPSTELIKIHSHETKLETVFQELSSFPMFGEHRLVVLRYAEALLAELEKQAKEFRRAKIIEEFQKYVCDPPQGIHIILHFQEKKVPEKFAKLQNPDFVFEERDLKDKDLLAYLLQRAKVLGYEMHLDAAEELLRNSAYDSRKALRYFDQLLLFKIQDKKINKEDVTELFDGGQGDLRWKFQDALCERKGKLMLTYFLSSFPEEGHVSLGFYYKSFLDLVRFRLLQRAGLSTSELREVLGWKHPAAGDRLRLMSQKYPPQEMPKILKNFLEFDYYLRQDANPVRSGLILTYFLLFLAGERE
ncbi:MAG: hypothetical protein NZM25_02205 [Leptospiraceae bacterium]|nr:hypothetical protein [Leptospiraceae bacterium]MDW8306990.1 hypothetical protein [Leptospiraceae bacterium]